jgi:hypothetical protein
MPDAPAGIGNPFLSAAETGGSLAVSMVVIFVGFVVNTVAVNRGKKDGVTEG